MNQSISQHEFEKCPGSCRLSQSKTNSHYTLCVQPGFDFVFYFSGFDIITLPITTVPRLGQWKVDLVVQSARRAFGVGDFALVAHD